MLSTYAKRLYGKYLLSSVIFLLIAAGIGLSLYSSLDMCTALCKHNQAYRLFGLHFEVFGFLFFGSLAALFFFLPKGNLQIFLPFVAIGGLGAELWFIFWQYQEKKVCPVCALIAFVVAALAVALCKYAKKRGLTMGKKIRLPLYAFALLAGFLFSVLGVTKISANEQKLTAIVNELAFGDASSPIKIYVFTDWFCPSCEAIEKQLEKITEQFSDKAALYFIDVPVHPETVNYTPYHLAFATHNKDKYFPLREALHNLGHKIKNPTDEDIESVASTAGGFLKELNYSDISQGISFFKETIEKFHISATPTLVLYNSQTKQKKALVGKNEINLENVQKAYTALSDQNKN